MHKSKEQAYMWIFLPCCLNLSNEALYDIAWSSQVHIAIIGIIFVGVLYCGTVIADLGVATKPGVLYVC
jgi:hypothetical protein